MNLLYTTELQTKRFTYRYPPDVEWLYRNVHRIHSAATILSAWRCRCWGVCWFTCIKEPRDAKRSTVAVVFWVQEGRFQLGVCKQGNGDKVESTPEKHAFLRIAGILCYGRPQSYLVLGFSGARRVVSRASEGMREPRSTTVFWLRS